MEQRPLKILIIDNRQVQADRLAELLGQKGFDAVRVSTGERGLTFAAANYVDAVLLNLDLEGLPRLKGVPGLEAPPEMEICRKLRLDPRLARTAVIHHARQRTGGNQTCCEDSILTDPVSFEELSAAIRQSIWRRRLRAAEDLPL